MQTPIRSAERPAAKPLERIPAVLLCFLRALLGSITPALVFRIRRKHKALPNTQNCSLKTDNSRSDDYRQEPAFPQTSYPEPLCAPALRQPVQDQSNPTLSTGSSTSPRYTPCWLDAKELAAGKFIVHHERCPFLDIEKKSTMMGA